MKYLFCLLAALSGLFSSNAQYYYQDIRGTDEIIGQMKLYAALQIQKVSATGFKPDGSVAPDFSEIQETDPGFQQLKIVAQSEGKPSWFLYTFDKQGNLLSLLDSSASLKSFTRYSYNSKGHLVEMTNFLVDSLMDVAQTEVHSWIYQNNRPEKMWRIINKNDSLLVQLRYDDAGNVIEEQNYKNGKAADPVYYYYDSKNRMTDIVRYNAKARKLLPDYMFEYDDQNRVIQKITTLSSQNLGYLIWRYSYNNDGLKTKEALYNKEKQLQGRIDYIYTRY